MQGKIKNGIKNVEIYDSATTSESNILKKEAAKNIVKNDFQKTSTLDNDYDNFEDQSKLEQLNRLADIIASIVLSEVN
ncbi:MAG: hypothetical protein V4556_12270 [Bacteroidota bacterium]